MASKNVFRIQVLGIFYSKSHISCCVVTLQKQKCGRIVRTHFCFYNMAATLRICLSFSTKALSFRAVCILYFICNFRRDLLVFTMFTNVFSFFKVIVFLFHLFFFLCQFLTHLVCTFAAEITITLYIIRYEGRKKEGVESLKSEI